MWRLLAAIILLGLTGCANREPVAVNLTERALAYPGFQTFPTPRTFDNPGYVFRIDRKGNKYPVVELHVPVQSVGFEQFPESTEHAVWRASALFSFLFGSGAVHAGGGGEATRLITTIVKLGPGERFRSYDDDVKKAVAALEIDYDDDSEYFVVRETIRISQIDVDLSDAFAWDAGVRIQVQEIINGSSKYSWTTNQKDSLRVKLEPPHNVFFTVDQLLPPGSPFSGSSQWMVATPGKRETAKWEAEQ